MSNLKPIPAEINDRLTHFQKEVTNYFSFLSNFNYLPEETQIGRHERFLNYYCNFCFKNGDTLISIDYQTDIIKGNVMAFPKEKQRPVFDNVISCSISDPNAFMSIDEFVEQTQPNMPKDHFTIELEASNVKGEISRVVKNYSKFFQGYLRDVLNKYKIYNCYTDRFYDKIFEEKHYR